jgi:hypothetical protein
LTSEPIEDSKFLKPKKERELLISLPIDAVINKKDELEIRILANHSTRPIF